ncbi:3-phosphoshikimate 1-carboxyvinyltransferase [Candidatus Woesearchaeota archaeon]|nr:3-phosphoshikimate 1-carboxyvinyltransferase [Candidatus Woesearchaeota archaeon]
MIAIKTKREINADVEAPPSKSYTQRALIIASLAKGNSTIKNALFSDDTHYMAEALREFGVKIERKGKDIAVRGTNGDLVLPKKDIFTGNAGTAMRFLTAFACLANGEVSITGDKRMQQRPIKDLLDVLEQLGVKSESANGCPPIKIYGGTFIGGKAMLKGNVSSQYLSSVLMCAPYAKKSVEVSVVGDLTSKPYINITLDVMKHFGTNVKNIGYRKFTVNPSDRYKAVSYKIEGDASSASYFLAAAAVTKGRVRVKNLNPSSRQGDIKFADMLKMMGCSVKKGKDFIEVRGAKLKGIDADMNSMPDAAPTLAVASIFADGATTIRNVENLRYKETDRLKALAFELRKIGAHVDEIRGGLKIKKKRLRKAIIETYDDHRMAMSFAVTGLMIDGIKIKNPNCVKKSFPDFWKKFNELYKK